MMRKIYYWQGLISISDDTELHQYQDKIHEILTAIMTGDTRYADFDTKIMKGHQFYTARINKTHRMLFTNFTADDGSNYLLLLEFIPEHRYDNARFLQRASILSDYLTQHRDSLNQLVKTQQTSTTTTSTTSAVAEPVQLIPFMHHNGHFIELNSAQHQATQMRLPAIVSGDPGTGKSSVALTLLSQLYHDVDLAEPKTILMLTKSSLLLTELKTQHDSLAPEPNGNTVIFATYNQAILKRSNPADILGIEDFKTWFAKLPKIGNGYIQAANHLKQLPDKPLPIEKIYDEMRIASPYSTVEEYAEVGSQNAVLPEAYRSAILSVLQAYRKTFSERVDPNFYQPQWETYAGNYTHIISDEVQDLSPLAVLAMAAAISPINLTIASPAARRAALLQVPLVMCLDPNQSLESHRSTRPFIMRHFYEAERDNHIHLPTSYRAGERILAVIQATNELANRLAGGVKDKFFAMEKTAIAAAAPKGAFYWLPAETTDATLKTVLALTQGYNITQVAIVTEPTLVAEAEAYFMKPAAKLALAAAKKKKSKETKHGEEKIAAPQIETQKEPTTYFPIFTQPQVKGFGYKIVIAYRPLYDNDFMLANRSLQKSTDANPKNRAKAGTATVDFEILMSGLYVTNSRAIDSLIYIQNPDKREALYQHFSPYISSATNLPAATSSTAANAPTETELQDATRRQFTAGNIAHAHYYYNQMNSSLSFEQVVTPTIEKKSAEIPAVVIAKPAATSKATVHTKTTKPVNTLETLKQVYALIDQNNDNEAQQLFVTLGKTPADFLKIKSIHQKTAVKTPSPTSTTKKEEKLKQLDDFAAKVVRADNDSSYEKLFQLNLSQLAHVMLRGNWSFHIELRMKLKPSIKRLFSDMLATKIPAGCSTPTSQLAVSSSSTPSTNLQALQTFSANLQALQTFLDATDANNRTMLAFLLENQIFAADLLPRLKQLAPYITISSLFNEYQKNGSSTTAIYELSRLKSSEQLDTLLYYDAVVTEVDLKSQLTPSDPTTLIQLLMTAKYFDSFEYIVNYFPRIIDITDVFDPAVIQAMNIELSTLQGEAHQLNRLRIKKLLCRLIAHNPGKITAEVMVKSSEKSRSLFTVLYAFSHVDELIAIVQHNPTCITSDMLLATYEGTRNSNILRIQLKEVMRQITTRPLPLYGTVPLLGDLRQGIPHNDPYHGWRHLLAHFIRVIAPAVTAEIICKPEHLTADEVTSTFLALCEYHAYDPIMLDYLLANGLFIPAEKLFERHHVTPSIQESGFYLLMGHQSSASYATLSHILKQDAAYIREVDLVELLFGLVGPEMARDKLRLAAMLQNPEGRDLLRIILDSREQNFLLILKTLMATRLEFDQAALDDVDSLPSSKNIFFANNHSLLEQPTPAAIMDRLLAMPTATTFRQLFTSIRPNTIKHVLFELQESATLCNLLEYRAEARVNFAMGLLQATKSTLSSQCVQTLFAQAAPGAPNLLYYAIDNNILNYDQLASIATHLDFSILMEEYHDAVVSSSLLLDIITRKLEPILLTLLKNGMTVSAEQLLSPLHSSQPMTSVLATLAKSPDFHACLSVIAENSPAAIPLAVLFRHSSELGTSLFIFLLQQMNDNDTTIELLLIYLIRHYRGQINVDHLIRSGNGNSSALIVALNNKLFYLVFEILRANPDCFSGQHLLHPLPLKLPQQTSSERSISLLSYFLEVHRQQLMAKPIHYHALQDTEGLADLNNPESNKEDGYIRKMVMFILHKTSRELSAEGIHHEIQLAGRPQSILLQLAALTRCDMEPLHYVLSQVTTPTAHALCQLYPTENNTMISPLRYLIDSSQDDGYTICRRLMQTKSDYFHGIATASLMHSFISADDTKSNTNSALRNMLSKAIGRQTFLEVIERSSNEFLVEMYAHLNSGLITESLYDNLLAVVPEPAHIAHAICKRLKAAAKLYLQRANTFIGSTSAANSTRVAEETGDSPSLRKLSTG